MFELISAREERRFSPQSFVRAALLVAATTAPACDGTTRQAAPAEVPAGAASADVPRLGEAQRVAPTAGGDAVLDPRGQLEYIAENDLWVRGGQRVTAPFPSGQPGGGEQPLPTALPTGPGVLEPVSELGPINHGDLVTDFADNLGSNADVAITGRGRTLSMAVRSLRQASATGEILAESPVAATAGIADVDGVTRVRYPSAFPGADVFFETRQNYLFAGIEMSELPTAVVGAERLELVETLQLPAGAGLVHRDEGDALAFVPAPARLELDGAVAIGASAEADPWFYITAPFARDMSGEQISLNAELEVDADGGARYVTRVPYAWLSAPERVFPVVVDPPVALGAAVPFISTAHLDRFPHNTDIVANLALTGQDALRANSDASMMWTIEWGDGTSSMAIAGPGAKVVRHTYADENACAATENICQVTVRVMDAIGRGTVETFTFPMPRTAAGWTSCRYTCRFDPTEEFLRSFWYRSSNCDACEADIAARCTNATPVESSCGGGQPAPAGCEADPCSPNATCTDTPGGADCDCNDGFLGDGITCTPTLCNDGIDNDNDGLIDLQDANCVDINQDDEGAFPACSDFIDNDADGLVDALDPGCDGPLDNDEFDAGTPTLPVSDIGCADGEREGFVDQNTYPDIAGCSGAWDIPGVHAFDPGTGPACPEITTTNTLNPACDRDAGDDGTNAAGAGCNVTDLCGVGWHVCRTSQDVLDSGANNCNDAVPGGQQLFFATRQSTNGCAVCADGLRVSADCNSAACTGGCFQTAVLSNDLYGCGNIGGGGSCGPLNQFTGDLCGSLGAPWNCGTNGLCEAYTITKSGTDRGGVLCCRD